MTSRIYTLPALLLALVSLQSPPSNPSRQEAPRLPASSQPLVASYALAQAGIQLNSNDARLTGYDDTEYVETLGDCRKQIRLKIDDWLQTVHQPASAAITEPGRVRVVIDLDAPLKGMLVLLYRPPLTQKIAYLDILFDSNQRLSSTQREQLVHQFDLVRLKQQLMQSMQCGSPSTSKIRFDDGMESSTAPARPPLSPPRPAIRLQPASFQATTPPAENETVLPCSWEHYIPSATEEQRRKFSQVWQDQLKMIQVAEEHELVLRIVCRAAADRDHKAEVLLGALALNGPYGFEPNEKQGRYWFRRAAVAGYAEAMGLLAGLYFQGRGGPVDAKEGLRWAEAGARTGDSTAQLELAGQYIFGENVARDFTKARYWANQALNGGNQDAEKMLALIDKYSPQQ